MATLRIVDVQHFPFRWLRMIKPQKRPAGNPGGKTRSAGRYKDIVTAFDIETTRLPDIEQGIMFVWQWAFGPELVVMGRTWDEFDAFATMLQGTCLEKDREKIVVWVHNLSFEFAFLRGIWRFEPADVFAISPRKILKATHGCLEFRCSYLHTNMSLDEYTAKMGVEHCKLTGTFDYDKIRYPWTPLSDDEIAYCINDVVGLVEALTVEMAADRDNLYSVPITSTGYVRRDIKHAVKDNVSRTFIESQVPTLRLYHLFRDAFRGGDVHANRYLVGQTIKRCHKADRSSSYPDIVCNDPFPVSAFYEHKGRMDYGELMKLILIRKKAVVCRCAISGLRLRDPFWPAPYLSRDKCDKIMTSADDWIDNGRILKADYLETAITDVDLRIIAKEYMWDDIVFWDVAYARYGKLPDAIINETIKYYRIKTELKGDASQEIYYNKSKNKLNAIYGMMAQIPLRRSIKYMQDGVLDEFGLLDYYPEDTSKTDAELLAEYKRRAFVVYQWGCWVTAWARYRLHEAIWTIDRQLADFVYCDTDSVVYLGPVDWTDYNTDRVTASLRSGAHAVDAKGHTHYMGVMEMEADCAEFRTLGAKKYVYRTDDGELHLTVAGVGKKSGAAELEAAGGIDAFRTGFTFKGPAGGIEAVYNDDPLLEPLHIDGHELVITPNVVLRPSTYRLGVADEYERLLRNRTYTIDF